MLMTLTAVTLQSVVEKRSRPSDRNLHSHRCVKALAHLR